MRNRFNTFNEKPFNMDLMFLERVNERLGEIDSITNEGNQISRYRCLHTIFINTHFKYLDKVEDLKAKFKKIKNSLKTSGSGMSKSSYAQHQSIVISMVEEELDDLHFTLIKLLYDNDLIYLKKMKNMPPEEEVATDY